MKRPNEEENSSLMTAFENMIAAFNAADADTFISYVDDECTAFGREGGVLFPLQSKMADDMKGLKVLVDAGGKLKVSFENLNVKVDGNMGVVTAYARFTRTSPDGKTEKPTLIRQSSTWTKRSGKWKMIHLHHSKLTENLPKEDE